MTEIVQREESSLELLPPAQVPSAGARAMLIEHAQNMETAHQLAKAMVRTQMVPKRFFGKADDAAAAILYGAELGLNPIQSLQRVVPIHGMPSLESRTMVGLLKAKGYKVRTVEQSETSVTVEGVAPDGETASSTWTIDRAILAGYVPIPSSPQSLRRPTVDGDWVTVTKTWDGKAKVSVLGNMKYITDPQTMLKAKAQAEVCRELAPEVLMGISYTREELESEDQRQFSRDEQPAPARTQRVTVDEILAEEVPISSDDGGRARSDNPPPAPKPAPTEAPAGDVTDDQGDGAPEPQPSPAAQPPAATSDSCVKPETAQAEAPADPAPAKKAPAKKAAPREVSKLRGALEKRLFTLLGDAGLSGDKERDGRIAVYRAITGRADIDSTNDLNDVEVGKVCDQLYRWQTDGVLGDQIADILFGFLRDADTTSEGTEK